MLGKSINKLQILKTSVSNRFGKFKYEYKDFLYQPCSKYGLYWCQTDMSCNVIGNSFLKILLFYPFLFRFWVFLKGD